jgi:hypothetical protein
LTAARNYCNRLLKAGELILDKKAPVTFEEFAEGFWDKNSEYVRRQESRADITDNYLDNCRQNLKNQILPFFGDMPLGSITEGVDWQFAAADARIKLKRLYPLIV